LDGLHVLVCVQVPAHHTSYVCGQGLVCVPACAWLCSLVCAVFLQVLELDAAAVGRRECLKCSIVMHPLAVG
jgi:hypothetical protein